MLGISDQSPSPAGSRPCSRCRSAAARPSASRPRRRRTCTAGRPTASSWSSRAGGTTSSTSTASPSDGSGPEVKLTDVAGLDDGPEYTPRRAVDLLQLRAQRHHADLAHEAGRQRPRSRSPTTRFNNWFPHISPDGQWIAIISFPSDVPPGRPSVLQARLPAPHADRAAGRQGGRVRLRRAGHDQRALVVAGQPHAGVREQYRHVLTRGSLEWPQPIRRILTLRNQNTLPWSCSAMRPVFALP